MGDSHIRGLASFSRKNGVSAWALPGGRIRHVHQLLAKQDYFRNQAKVLVILCGGNDLVSPDYDPYEYVRELESLICSFAQHNPDCVCVTATPIPRDDWNVRAPAFIERIESLDAGMYNFFSDHHHLVSDAFVQDPLLPGGQANIRTELYQADYTHLNKDGVALLETILSFVLLSVSSDDYSKNCDIGEGGDFRMAFWKY